MKTGKKITRTLYLDEGIDNAIARIAQREHRSVAKQAALMLEQALLNEVETVIDETEVRLTEKGKEAARQRKTDAELYAEPKVRLTKKGKQLAQARQEAAQISEAL